MKQKTLLKERKKDKAKNIELLLEMKTRPIHKRFQDPLL